MKAIAVLKLPKSKPAISAVARSIVASMTDNPFFPSPSPSLAAVQAAIDAYAAAEATTLTRTRGTAAARNAKLDALRTTLTRLLAYVQSVADDHEADAAAIIESAGMYVKGPPTRHKADLVARQGAVSGTADLIAKAVAKRAVYHFESSMDGITWVEAAPTLSAKITLVGLQPERRHFFRVRAVTKAGLGDYGQVVTLFVL